MADIKVNRESSGRQTGLSRRSESFPSFLSLNPHDLFTISPIDMLHRFTNEMDRFFGTAPTQHGGSLWAPAVEVRQEGGNLKVSAELPGLGKDDVKVEITDEGLVIQGERKREQHEERGGYYRSERSYGHFYRLIPLPEDAQIDQAKAQFDNGVLNITVPVPAQERRRREVPIETGTKSKGAGQ